MRDEGNGPDLSRIYGDLIVNLGSYFMVKVARGHKNKLVKSGNLWFTADCRKKRKAISLALRKKDPIAVRLARKEYTSTIELAKGAWEEDHWQELKRAASVKDSTLFWDLINKLTRRGAESVPNHITEQQWYSHFSNLYCCEADSEQLLDAESELELD